MNLLTMMSLLRLVDFGVFGGIALLAGLVGLLTTVFWIVELVDVLRREFPEPATKVVWVLVILFTHVLGAVIYLFRREAAGSLAGR